MWAALPLSLLLCLGASSSARAQNFPVAPGNTVPLNFNLTNDPSSEEDFQAVYLIYSTSSYVQTDQGTVAGPVEISIGPYKRRHGRRRS